MKNLISESFKGLKQKASCAFSGAWLRTRNPSALKAQRVPREFVSERSERWNDVNLRDAGLVSLSGVLTLAKLVIMGQTRALHAVTVR